jgi:hypothetical protein
MSSYLRFERLPRVESRKTDIWEIFNMTEVTPLGRIRFRPGWRKYVFTQARPGIDWDAKCMTEIVSFLDDQTLLWRSGHHADDVNVGVRPSAVSV